MPANVATYRAISQAWPAPTKESTRTSGFAEGKSVATQPCLSDNHYND